VLIERHRILGDVRDWDRCWGWSLVRDRATRESFLMNAGVALKCGRACIEEGVDRALALIGNALS
jgi:hypothetical protein